MADYYQVLGLPFGAPVEQVRVRYRELARLYHPDVSREPDAEEKMRLLNEAYRVLSDPSLRLQYHLRLLARRQRHYQKRRLARQVAFRKIYDYRLITTTATIPAYLRYVLVGLLVSITGATAFYHYQNPFLSKKAHLNGYGWKAWPPFLTLPPSITEVYLQRNRFRAVPEPLWSLAQLQVLKLDDNLLSHLSSHITRLSQLEHLSLAGNQLRHLPRGWSDLERLRVLDLQRNHLREVPEEILDLPRLERLDLRENPLSEETKTKLLNHPRRSAVRW